MTCVLLQPSYIPWRGYFHQIQRADLFIFYDDVQYDKHGWRNRNLVKSPKGPHWLTIPVRSSGAMANKTPINEIEIVWEKPWNRSHRQTIHQFYAKAPYYRRYSALLDEIYAPEPRLLADFTIGSTIRLARELGIEHTRFMRSSELTVNGAKTDRILEILGAVGAKHYLSGPSARDYIEQEKFDQAGITLEYINYDYPPYPQLHGDFEAQVSILDLLLMTGETAHQYIWARQEDGATAGPSQ